MTKKYCPDCGAKLPASEDDQETIISVVIDESGSMESLQEKTISGFNEYITTLKQKGVKGRVTLTKFNSVKGAEIVYSNRLLSNVPKLNKDTYQPAECTPLYDAIGKTVKKLDRACTDKVIMVIITDGLENASHEYSQSQIREMITSRQNKGWSFVYLGANQDSWAAGGAIGIVGYTISNYDPIHTRHIYGAAATMTCCYAATGSIGDSAADTVADAIQSS